MRLFKLAAIAMLLSPAGSFAQQATSNSDNEADLRNQLNSVVKLLQDTRDQLKSSQVQIEQLRAEVDALKSGTHSAQNADTPAPEATAATLAHVQETQSVTDSRLEQLYQTKVESGSKYRVKLSGLILFSGGFNRGTVENQDVPMLALRTPVGRSGGSITATMRQTLMTVSVSGPTAFGARTSGEVNFDFFGGMPDTLDGNAMGIVRLRTGQIAFNWDRWSLSAMQDQPFISPLSPTSLATIGAPSLGYSGNLWTWTPQLVVKHQMDWTSKVNSTLQIGVLDPFTGEEPASEFARSPEAGEKSRMPAIAARHALSFAIGDRKATIGVGGLYSRHDFNFGRVVNGYAATVDYLIPLTQQFELSGEFFRGRAIGGMWGGIGTSVVMNGPQSSAATGVFPVNAIGGWTQLKFRPAEKWQINAAFGIDNPFTSDILHYSSVGSPYRPALRNSTAVLNVIQHPRSNLALSIEYRHLNTVPYSQRRATAEHVNLGIGVNF